MSELNELCEQSLPFIVLIAKGFLLLSLIVAALGAVITIVTVVMGWFGRGPDAEAGGGATATSLDALRKLIDSLAKAPSWFAMFLAGLLLLWILPNATEGMCEFDLTQDQREGTPSDQENSEDHTGEEPGAVT